MADDDKTVTKKAKTLRAGTKKTATKKAPSKKATAKKTTAKKTVATKTVATKKVAASKKAVAKTTPPAPPRPTSSPTSTTRPRAAVAPQRKPASTPQSSLPLGERPITPKPTAVSPEQREAMIQEAAYYKAERRNFAPGFELQDWAEAEWEIDEQLRRS